MEVPSCRFRCKMTTRSRMDLFQGPVCCNISGLLSSWAAPPRVQYVSFRDNDCCHICGLLSSWCVWPYTSPVLLCPCRIVCLFFHSVIIAMVFFHPVLLCQLYNTSAIHRTRRYGSSFMWHQPCQRCKYTSSVDIEKGAIKS